MRGHFISRKYARACGGTSGLGGSDVKGLQLFSVKGHGKYGEKFKVGLNKNEALKKINGATVFNPYEAYVAKQIVNIFEKGRLKKNNLHGFAVWLYKNNLIKPPGRSVKFTRGFDKLPKNNFFISIVGKSIIYKVLYVLASEKFGFLVPAGKSGDKLKKSIARTGAEKKITSNDLVRNIPFVWEINQDYKKLIFDLTRALVSVPPKKKAGGNKPMAFWSEEGAKVQSTMKPVLSLAPVRQAPSDYQVALKLIEVVQELSSQGKPATFEHIIPEFGKLPKEELREFRRFGPQAKISNPFAFVVPKRIRDVGQVLIEQKIMKRVALK